VVCKPWAAAFLLAASTGRSQTPSASAIAKVDEFLTRAAALNQFNGVALIAQRGRILYEKPFGLANMEWGVPNVADSRFEIASMTKPITAIAIMQLVEEGKVRLDGHVSDYVPFYPRETGDRITIDQLLSHTSGLQQDIAFADDPNNVPAVVPLINADLLSNDSIVKLIAQRPLRFAPGTSYGYSSDAYAVLGAVIEHVTGMPVWRALKMRVLDRAGMTETGVSLLGPLVPHRTNGYAQTFAGFDNAPHIGITPAGGLYSTIRDLYRFDRALTTDTLVHAASKQRLFAIRSVATAYGWKTSEEVRLDGAHRQILRTTGGLPGYENLMVRIPSQDRVIIFLSNTRHLVWRLDDFAVALNHILDGEPYALPRRSLAEAAAAEFNGGVRAGDLRRFLITNRADTSDYTLDEAEINRLGYHLLYPRNAPADAVVVFTFNAEAFPRSANVYDSLGEALLAAGDTTRAIANYRRSLALDPNNSNAAAVLKRVGASP
jgi:CubicO group peptidase (beta-lactamase class C family)